MNDSAGYTDTLQAGHLGAAPDVGPVHFQPIILRFGSIISYCSDNIPSDVIILFESSESFTLYLKLSSNLYCRLLSPLDFCKYVQMPACCPGSRYFGIVK